MNGYSSTPNPCRDIQERLISEIPSERILEVIKEMLAANVLTKSGALQPDFRAREAGLKLYMAYVVGLPIQREIVKIKQAEPKADYWEELKNSPAAMNYMRTEMARVEEELAREQRSDGADLSIQKQKLDEESADRWG